MFQIYKTLALYRYRSQKKSWMDSILFEEWIREVDRRFNKEGQKIVLLVDNCPAHPSIDNLVSTELIFLPPNTTSKLQPIDQGVIRSLKAYYKTMSIKKSIEAIRKKKTLPEFSILDAMQILDVTWGKVTTKTVVNRRKAIWSPARCWRSLQRSLGTTG